MNLATESSRPTLPSIFEQFPRVSTQSRHAIKLRKTLFFASLAAVPAAVGVALGLSSWKRGAIAGGVAALALGALRMQMARWFTEEPDYVREAAIDELELRTYPSRVEAVTEVDASEFEEALSLGFNRLACYIDGANGNREVIEMAAPVVTTMRDGRYSMTFVMPPGRDLGSLPGPDDFRVYLHEAGEKRIAALRFHGRFSKENVAKHERMLLKQLVDAGLSARGSVQFAGYDAPTTLPVLRRNELWIEIV
jgi:hypothetical protein